MLKLKDIDSKIVECKTILSDTNKEMWELYRKSQNQKRQLKVLKKEREDILFELVCEYVEVDQELVIPNIRYKSRSILRSGDTIRVKRKNNKSINVEIVATASPKYKYSAGADPRIGKVSRVQPHIFGRSVYNIPSIRKASERNQILKELIG